MNITIGRAKDNLITYEHETVSKYHLKGQYRKDLSLEIEDIQSSGGTFVNGRQVKTITITEKDQLRLGEFEVSVDALFKELKKIYTANKIDFVEEFEEVLVDFKKYKKKKHRISEGQGKTGQIIKISLTVIAMGILISPIAKSIEPSLRTSLIVGAGVLGSVFTIFSASGSKKKEQLELLQLEYESKLVCPKCNASLMDKTLAYYKTKKGCAKCDAIFFK